MSQNKETKKNNHALNCAKLVTVSTSNDNAANIDFTANQYKIGRRFPVLNTFAEQTIVKLTPSEAKASYMVCRKGILNSILNRLRYL